VLADTLDQIASTTITEVGELYKDFLAVREDLTSMYRKNDFYLQDIQPYASKLM
jgi:hypothetical protein